MNYLQSQVIMEKVIKVPNQAEARQDSGVQSGRANATHHEGGFEEGACGVP